MKRGGGVGRSTVIFVDDRWRPIISLWLISLPLRMVSVGLGSPARNDIGDGNGDDCEAIPATRCGAVCNAWQVTRRTVLITTA